MLANESWRQLFGRDGLDAADALTRADGSGSAFPAVSQAWLADGERAHTADFARTEPYRRFRCYSAPVRDRAGTSIGRIFVQRDVTWESEAERLRTALVATVSHELRAPLTTISGYVATLLHAGPWELQARTEMLQIVAQAAAGLAELVDNLVDAAVMDAGDLRLQREPLRLERLLERLVAQRQPLAPLCPLTVAAEPGLPLAEADPARVEQVLANLVDNAIKYSPSGGPVTLQAVAEGDRMVTVRVSDRGIGIVSDQLERLFERFYRVDSDAVRAQPGIGLGLYICRRIIESHGGHIWVESQPGSGSTFAFTLPRLEGEVAV